MNKPHQFSAKSMFVAIAFIAFLTFAATKAGVVYPSDFGAIISTWTFILATVFSGVVLYGERWLWVYAGIGGGLCATVFSVLPMYFSHYVGNLEAFWALAFFFMHGAIAGAGVGLIRNRPSRVTGILLLVGASASLVAMLNR